MDKQFALNQIRHKRNSYVYTCAGIYLLNSNAVHLLTDVIALFNRSGIIFNPAEIERINGRMEVELSQVPNARANERANFDVDIDELYKFVRRNLLKEAYETTYEYAKSNGLLSNFKAMPWYWYARIIRNTVSHSLRYDFRAKDIRAALPIKWEGKSIDISMNGQAMRPDIADPLTTVRLVDEMQDFILKH